ncbi:hypothetical protein SO802_018500 [Lithocarpus litseifolius]|uniref:Uncharacterized protein n=1 Tax=Lithocarpus litseifolius TaxID=425828 RepID=A0AAW2CNB2_9ROSI
MKLTAVEEEVIAKSEEGRLPEIESCNLSLIGQFLTCKVFISFFGNFRVVISRREDLLAVYGVPNLKLVFSWALRLWHCQAYYLEFDWQSVCPNGLWCWSVCSVACMRISHLEAVVE